MHRIVFLNRSYWPDAEATGQLLTDLCEALVDTFDVDVVCGQPNTTVGNDGFRQTGTEVRNGVRIHRLPHTTFSKGIPAGRILNLVSFYRAAGSYLRRSRLRADVVIPESDPFLLPIAAARHVRRHGGKLVCYVQDIYPDVAEAVGKARPGLLTGQIRRRLRDAYRAADRVIVLSDCMADRLRSSPWGIDPDRIAVIPNWSDCTAIAPIPSDDNRFRRDHDLNGRFVVMHSGNMGLTQQLDQMIAAAAAPDWPEQAVLILVGDGASRPRLERQAAALPVGRVRVLPYQSRERLADSLSAADLHVVSMAEPVTGCLSPSKFYGILAAGRPTLAITSPETEVFRTVETEGLGWCCPPGDVTAIVTAVADAVADPDRRERMGRSARRLAEADFDRPVVTRRFAELVDSVLGNSLPRSVRAPSVPTLKTDVVATPETSTRRTD